MRIYVVVSLAKGITGYNQTNELVTTDEVNANEFCLTLTSKMQESDWLSPVWVEVWENGIKL